MCYPVCGMVNIIEPLLNSCSGGSGFPLSLSERSFTICSTPYNCKYNVMNASLTKTFPNFLCNIVNIALVDFYNVLVKCISFNLIVR